MVLEINKKTVSDQIVDHFKEQIESGKLKPGDAFPSERKLEKELKISRKTINKAVSILAGQGYLFKEQGKATFVADFRKNNFSNNAAESYGFCFESPACVYHPTTAPLFRELCQNTTLQERGIKLIFGGQNKSPAVFNEIQGLFLFDEIAPDLLNGINVPAVIFNREFFKKPDNFKACCIYPDIVDALKRSVEYLTQQGHSQIAFIYGVKTWPEDIMRLEVFEQSLKKFGCDFTEDMTAPSNYDHAMTIKAVDKVLKHNPTAIIGADDMVARWIIEHLQSLGKSVPQDVSVIGFNNMEMYSLRSPELTTFQNNYIKMAELAIDYMLSDSKNKENVKYPVKFDFISRESVKKLS